MAPQKLSKRDAVLDAATPLCANMRETTLSFFKVEGTESLHDRNGQRKS